MFQQLCISFNPVHELLRFISGRFNPVLVVNKALYAKFAIWENFDFAKVSVASAGLYSYTTCVTTVKVGMQW